MRWSLLVIPLSLTYLGLAALYVASPAMADGQPPTQFWYFCPKSNGFYPYVPSCPSGWQQVPAGTQMNAQPNNMMLPSDAITRQQVQASTPANVSPSNPKPPSSAPTTDSQHEVTAGILMNAPPSDSTLPADAATSPPSKPSVNTFVHFRMGTGKNPHRWYYLGMAAKSKFYLDINNVFEVAPDGDLQIIIPAKYTGYAIGETNVRMSCTKKIMILDVKINQPEYLEYVPDRNGIDWKTYHFLCEEKHWYPSEMPIQYR